MKKSKWSDPSRLDLLFAVLMAIVSLTTAVAAWRTNAVGSQAADTLHRGLVDAIKKDAAMNEDWRRAYEEAGYARDWAIALAGIQSLENSGDAAAVQRAGIMRQFLLPGLASLAGPFAADSAYRKADGTFDVDKRFASLEAETPDLAGLDPQASFQRAAVSFNEQRWLVVGTVLLALSLFWLGAAQISKGRLRSLARAAGTAIYVFGLAWFLVVEVVFLFIHRGGL